jgi:hypothetical protein
VPLLHREEPAHRDVSAGYIIAQRSYRHGRARPGHPRLLDAAQCWPEARKKLRQAAYDTKVKIRGRKQLENKRVTRDGDYSDLHTDIDRQYWVTSEINALATSQESQAHYHTDPQTAFSWGPKGPDERNHYAQLLVSWGDILRE